jgi:hypothetical protein
MTEKFRHILVFDSFIGRIYSNELIKVLPGKYLSAKIAYKQSVEEVTSKIWGNWHLYAPREHFEYAPKDIHLPDEAKITGCLHIIELGIYELSHLYSEYNDNINGIKQLDEFMASDRYNSIKWAKRYGLFSAIVIIDDREPITEGHLRQIKSIYELSEKDVILRASLITQPEMLLATLDKLI